MAADNNYSLGPVPNTARKGVASLTMVMLGLTFFSASMWTGGSLGTGLSFDDFFLAVLIGNLILGHLHFFPRLHRRFYWSLYSPPCSFLIWL